MTEALGDWLRALAGCAAVCALALAVCPAGRVRQVLSLVCGIVMALAIVSPVLKFDFDAFSSSMALYRERAQDAARGGDEAQSELNRSIIQAECAAYILDKAEQLGLSGTAEVYARWSTEGCWYPYEARLRLSGEKAGRDALAEKITAELGIPPDRQHWSVD